MKRIFTFFLTLFVASSVWAFEIDGINYEHNSQTKTCSVVSGNYSGDIIIPATITGRHMDFAQSIVVMGGAKSKNGSSYTFDHGVQTKTQLGDNATAVVFCFQTIDENRNTLENFRFISGTEAVNEIIRTQASETKFVMISDATQEEFETVDWSYATTTIDIDRKLEKGNNTVAFKNEKCEGFFEVVSYDEDAEDLTINIWVLMPFEDASVTIIESSAFSNCTDLNSVTIPNSVTSIGEYAFSGCKGLTSISIPNSVTSVGRYAFLNCTNLKNAVIGANVESIGANAFSDCSSLSKITCYAVEPPTVDASSFSNYNGYLTISCDNFEAYDIHAVWGTFKHVDCIGSETIELTKDEVAVVPEKTEAEFSMPKNENANSYTLTISNNGVTFCTLKFNAQGQLANIDFSTTKSYELKSEVEGFQFTVTGLSTASDYGYSFKALASNKSVLKEYSGSFTTKNEDGTGGSVQGGGEGSLAVEAISNATAITIVNGQIFVNGEAPAFVVNVSGQKIANANLKSGVYFVVVDGETVGVSVR